MERNQAQKKMKSVIFVLMALLALSGTLLAGTILYRYFAGTEHASTEVPDNLITPEKEISCEMPEAMLASRDIQVVRMAASSIVEQKSSGDTVLKLYRNHAEDTVPFQVNNMFPGDQEEKTYCLEVSYKGTLTLHFHADIRAGYEKLAEVLKCRVSLENGTILYDGLMRDMPESIPYLLPQQNQAAAVDVLYDVTVYLDTSVGNEYMEKELIADFRWWVQVDGSSNENGTKPDGGSHKETVTETTGGSGTSGETSAEVTPKPDSGELIAPKTGDTSDLLFWLIVGGASLLLMMLLLFVRQREKEAENHEQ